MRLARFGVLAWVVSCAALLVWVFPFLWMLATSFKTLPEVVHDPTALLPRTPGFGAYAEVFRSIAVGRAFAISSFVAVAIALLQILFALPAGYALGTLRYRGRTAAFGLVVAALLIPAQVTFVPVFVLLAHARLVNTVAALVVPFAASALGTFMVRQAMSGIPNEYVEAARLDGASEATIVYRVLAPIVWPTLTSFFLISFVFHWNDYFWPLVMTTDDSVRTLPLAVALLREQGTGPRWHVVMAGNVLLSLPPLVLFALAQKQLLRSVRQGG